MSRKMHVKKGDKVVILTGTERGDTGVILDVFPKTQKVTVDGKNMVWKHQKPRPPAEEGGRKQIPAPLHVSNVKKIEDKKTKKSSKKQAKKK